MTSILKILQKPIFLDKRFITFVWFFVALIAGLKHSFKGVFNDYIIFKSVFYNTLAQANLYLEYPELHGDSNHYGPIFSLIFAPFALLPDNIGTIFWDLAMAGGLFWAIYKLPIIWKTKAIILYICLISLYANVVNSETNAVTAAFIIGAFICIKSEKDFWAAFFIILGTFIKLYSIVGLAFFFFSKHKIKFIGYLFLWSIILFVLPMLISSPAFIIQSYADWYEALVIKNSLNITSINQDISVMGMIRRISGYYDLSNLPILIGGILLFATQYIQFNYYSRLNYQLGILASTLMFIVLFSTSSETCTYIIATSGAAIWFILQKKSKGNTATYLLLFMIIVSLMASGICPAYIRIDIIRAHSLNALPIFIIWLILVYQLATYNRSQNMLVSDSELTID